MTNRFNPPIATHDRKFTINEAAIQKQVISSIFSGLIGAGVTYFVFKQHNK